MKTEGQVIQRLKQVQFRRVKKELSQLLSVRPENCSNHKALGVPSGPVSICSLDCSLCDLKRSQACGDYAPKYEKENLKDSLRHFFETRSPKDVYVRFPVVSTLMWVLSDEEFPYLEPAPVEVAGVPVWADTEQNAEALREHVEGLETQVSALRQQVKELTEVTVQAPERKTFWSRLFR